MDGDTDGCVYRFPKITRCPGDKVVSLCAMVNLLPPTHLAGSLGMTHLYLNRVKSPIFFFSSAHGVRGVTLE